MSLVTVEKPRPHVTLVTLNRPERLNALSYPMVTAIHDALDMIAMDNDCQAVVLTGAGRGFCSGLDLKEIGPSLASTGLSGPHGGMRSQEFIADLIPHLRKIPQPVVAAVNGAAFGGGLAIACGCDIRVIAAEARLCVQFIKMGLSGTDIGISYTLPRLVGASRAFDLILTGREFTATEALDIGLASRVVPGAEVVTAALDIADQLTAAAPFGLMMTKQVLWANLDAGSLEAALHAENRNQILCSQTGDINEAVRAFAEGRAPNYRRD